MWYNVEKCRTGGDDMILYFSKVNLSSVQLLEMYQESEMFDEMRKNILSFLKSGTIYQVEKFYKDERGEIHPITTKYRLVTGIKTDDYISGVIYKSTTLYYKKINDATSEVESHSIPTIEDVKFYFDVNREIVGFHTRNRFGYQEFNSAFAGIINMCMAQNSSSFTFSVELYNEGLEINEIDRELKSINNIKRLEFKFKLPNPADDKMLQELQDGLTNTAEQLEEANANSMSVIFDSDGGIGLNIDSCEIQKNIKRVGSLTAGLSDKDAIQNGYARVIATAKDGKIYTTEEQKPVKREIQDEEDESFFKACRDTIRNILVRRINSSHQRTE